MEMRKLGVGLVGGAAVCGLLASASVQAAPVLLQDRNSTAAFNTEPGDGTPAGMHSWVVDGQEQLVQQWFWFRVGNSGPEQSLETLPLDTWAVYNQARRDPSVDTLHLDYLAQNYQVGGQFYDFEITVDHSLRGGAVGSGMSDLGEQISIYNNGDKPMEFHFFQFVDLNLNGVASDDVVRIEGGRAAIVTDPTGGVQETVTTPLPSHFQAGLASVIRGALQDSAPTTLSDDAGPVSGDVGYAFEWDVTLAPGGSMLISKDKHILVPEPASLGLLATGALALLSRRRRAH